MSDKERFEAFKKNLVEKNELVYGAEVREKYGDDDADIANRKFLKMTEEQYQRFQDLETAIKTRLTQAARSGATPESEEMKEIVKLHREWLMMTWKQYTKEAHIGIAQMYCADERFRSYYDKEEEGCAALLCAAVEANA